MAKHLLTVVLFGAATLPAAIAQQASQAVLRERYESLTSMLSTLPVENVVNVRGSCAAGRAPAAIKMNRSSGFDFAPDASEECPTTLLRLAREGMLLSYYRDLMVKATGRDVGHEKVPPAVAAAAMQGKPEVVLGNQRAVPVSSSLAFDAGFTMAYQQRQPVTNAMPGLAVLKTIAERCLGEEEGDRGLCYATGFSYGARAVTGQPLAIAPR